MCNYKAYYQGQVANFNGQYENKLYVYMGPAGSGKTTLLLKIAADFVGQGKKVLYLSVSEPFSYLVRLWEQVSHRAYSADGQSIVFGSCYDCGCLELRKLMFQGNERYDAIICDGLDYSDYVEFLASSSAEYRVPIIVAAPITVLMSMACGKAGVFLANIFEGFAEAEADVVAPDVLAVLDEKTKETMLRTCVKAKKYFDELGVIDKDGNLTEDYKSEEN